MKTSRLLITTAAILAIAAPAASAARPWTPPPPGRTSRRRRPRRPSSPTRSSSAPSSTSSRGQGAEATPLTDRTGTDNGFPVGFVLLGLTIPLGIGIGMLAGRPVRSYVAAHRRPPASAA